MNSKFPDAQPLRSFAPDFATENQPVFFHGALSEAERKPFRLAREIHRDGPSLFTFAISSDAVSPSSPVRPMFRIPKSDPITTRVLQLWRPAAHDSKTQCLNEFIWLRPPDPLLCWLVVMRAVEVGDVLNAIGEYGWSGTERPDRTVPGHIRLEDCSGDVAEFRHRTEWALLETSSQYEVEWLDREDAAALLTACEAAIAAKKEDEATR